MIYSAQAHNMYLQDIHIPISTLSHGINRFFEKKNIEKDNDD